MRYFITFVALCLTASMGSCQEVPDYSSRINEISLGFNRITGNGSNTCIGYKHNFSSGALRAGAELSIYSWGDEDESFNLTGHNYAISPKIGYEFQESFNRFKIYYGADLVYSLGRYKREEYDIDSEGVDLAIDRNQKIALRPLLGLQVFIFESISISVESFFDIAYLTAAENSPGSDDPWVNTMTAVSANLVPLGLLSVNYHF